MSDSVPPPPRASLRGHLRRAATLSRTVATILVACVAVRFAVEGVHHALGVSSANFAEKPAPHARTEPHLSSGAKLAPASSAPALGSGAPGRPRRVTLGVSVGSPRSEVYVNGSFVGQTPFLGDTSCKSGQSIKIDVVPDKGAPLTYVRECRGGSIDISGPPP